MIDPKTQTACYEIGGRKLYLRSITVTQAGKWEVFKTSHAEFARDGENDYRFFTDAETLAKLLSIGLTDSDGNEVTVSEADAGKIPFEMLGEILNDFFLLHPSLTEFLKLWLAAIPHSMPKAEQPAGQEPNIGNT